MVWELCLEHNSKIFREMAHTPAQVVSKAQVLMGDYLKIISLPKNVVPLSPEE